MRTGRDYDERWSMNQEWEAKADELEGVIIEKDKEIAELKAVMQKDSEDFYTIQQCANLKILHRQEDYVYAITSEALKRIQALRKES